MRTASMSAARRALPARSAADWHLGLTARRFVDLGRTGSMMCHRLAY